MNDVRYMARTLQEFILQGVLPSSCLATQGPCQVFLVGGCFCQIFHCFKAKSIVLVGIFVSMFRCVSKRSHTTRGKNECRKL